MWFFFFESIALKRECLKLKEKKIIVVYFISPSSTNMSLWETIKKKQWKKIFKDLKKVINFLAMWSFSCLETLNKVNFKKEIDKCRWTVWISLSIMYKYFCPYYILHPNIKLFFFWFEHIKLLFFKLKAISTCATTLPSGKN